MQISGYNITFSNPPNCDIVIFDGLNSHLLETVIPKNLKTSIYPIGPTKIWVSLKTVSIFFSRIFKHIQFDKTQKQNSNLFYRFFKYCYLVFIESCLIAMKPKAVITYIDNSGVYSWLSENCRVFPFISIQNGGRLSYASVNTPNYYCQHLFCFGEHETVLFPKIGFNVEKYYPAGSLPASLYFNQEKNNIPIKYDVLIISTWRGNIGFPKDVIDTMRSMRIMDERLAKYIRSRKIKAAVILRAEVDSEHWYINEIGMNESQYFESIYGDNIEIINNDFSKRPIYKIIKQSRMLISCLSTALIEGFSIGKKALYYNFCGTNEYHQDFDPLIVSTISDQNLFNFNLDQILAMPDNIYKNKYGNLQKYYMSFPSNYETSDYIKKQINLIIDKYSKNAD